MDVTGGYQEYRFVAEFYDHVSPYKDRADIAFYVERARQVDGRILEIGCGTGRVLLPIARAGKSIVGIDLSTHMLTICAERLAREPETVRTRVELVRADMRDFHVDGDFALAIIPFRPFQHLLTVEDQLACLHAVHRHLTPGGTFILDIFDPYLPMLVEEQYLQEHADEPVFEMPDGRRVQRMHRMLARDPSRQVNEHELIYYVTHPDGSEERMVHHFNLRYLFRY
jgi:SAM-dependent methyltransferase